MNGIQEVSGSIPLISTIRWCAEYSFYIELASVVKQVFLFFGSEPQTSCIFNHSRQRRLCGVYRRIGQRFDPAYLQQENGQRLAVHFPVCAFGAFIRFAHFCERVIPSPLALSPCMFTLSLLRTAHLRYRDGALSILFYWTCLVGRFFVFLDTFSAANILF